MILILEKWSEVYLIQIIRYLEAPLVVATQEPPCLPPNLLLVCALAMHLASTIQLIEISHSSFLTGQLFVLIKCWICIFQLDKVLLRLYT